MSIKGVPRILVRWPIAVYCRFISPALPRRCRYEPTCSRYALEAVSDHGAFRGLILASWRLLRCNPFSHGGYDPVAAQRLFRRPPANPAVPDCHHRVAV